MPDVRQKFRILRKLGDLPDPLPSDEAIASSVVRELESAGVRDVVVDECGWLPVMIHGAAFMVKGTAIR